MYKMIARMVRAVSSWPHVQLLDQAASWAVVEFELFVHF